MYTWISEEAKEQLDLMMKNYDNEVSDAKSKLEQKQEDAQKPFYKLSHWQAKFSYDHVVNENKKTIKNRVLFHDLKFDLYYGINSLAVQNGVDNMSIVKRNIYETVKKCYKMYNRILTNILSNEDLSDEMLNDYAFIADKMHDYLNQISFRIPKNTEMQKMVSEDDLDKITSFPNIYSICELALLKDWSYEEFLNTVLIFHAFRQKDEEETKILNEDLSNIYEFNRKELLQIKISLLNEACKLNEETEKQNQKLELIKNINQYL